MSELRRIRDQVTCLQCGNVTDREIAVFTDQAIRTENERLRARIVEQKEALAEVMAWILNWSPSFVEDEEWPETEQKARKVLADA